MPGRVALHQPLSSVYISFLRRYNRLDMSSLASPASWVIGIAVAQTFCAALRHPGCAGALMAEPVRT